MEKQHYWRGIAPCTLDSLITELKNDAIKFSFQTSHIVEEVVFFAVMASIMKTDQPPTADAVELVVDEAFDIQFEPLGLLAVLLLYLGLYSVI